jgi:site-specific recombinase XerD
LTYRLASPGGLFESAGQSPIGRFQSKGRFSRMSQIFSLTWGDVDMERGVLILRDTKSGKTRAAYMTEAVAAMLAGITRRGHNDLVFLSANGGRIVQISETFNRVVAALSFNNGVTDPRQKVVFHTLRHTFASWLVEQGIDLYSVKELMGHGTLAMTERYSHLSPDKLRRAVKTLEAGMDKARAKGKVVAIDGTR